MRTNRGVGPRASHTNATPRSGWQTAILAIVCVCAGAAPLAVRWIADDVARIACGLVIAVAYLALALYARGTAPLHQFWELALAFFVLALVQVLNNSIPGFVGTYILHDPPNDGDPLASTVSGTLIIQVLETLIALVPIITITRAARQDLGSVYAKAHVSRGWLALALGVFVVVYLFIATIPLRPGSITERLLPTNGPVPIDRFVALTPALLVMGIANGFEEEFLFRGLFLQKYSLLLGPPLANVVQALVFTVAHVGVTYTPSVLLFLVAVVFPLGLITGYLMRASNGVIVPAIIHAALDIAIYLPFLSHAS